MTLTAEQFHSFRPAAILCLALFSTMQQGDCLQEIGVRQPFRERRTSVRQRGRKAEGGAARPGTPSTPCQSSRRTMAARGVHGGDELEGVERLAAGIHLLEDETDGFVRGVGAERDDWQLVGLEVLQDVVLEGLEKLLASPRSRSKPVFVEPVLPFVPVKGWFSGNNKLLVFKLGC